MKFEKHKEIIDKYPFIKEVEISNNGEPFLNPDIKKILEYSYEKMFQLLLIMEQISIMFQMMFWKL